MPLPLIAGGAAATTASLTARIAAMKATAAAAKAAAKKRDIADAGLALTVPTALTAGGMYGAVMGPIRDEKNRKAYKEAKDHMDNMKEEEAEMKARRGMKSGGAVNKFKGFGKAKHV